MATPVKKQAARTPRAKDSRALYLYGISRTGKQSPEISAEPVDAEGAIEAMTIGAFDCWISRVNRNEFADRFTENMENLEWLATVGVRHQRAVSELSARVAMIPARFGTIFLSEASLREHVAAEAKSMEAVLRKIANADEWGIKIFREPKAVKAAPVEAASGTEYLKRKAQTAMPKRDAQHPEVEAFIETLTKASAASASGGKASSGQPNLLWHGSFLVTRKAHPKFEAALRKATKSLPEEYRVECSGPWPPYSFVGKHD